MPEKNVSPQQNGSAGDTTQNYKHLERMTTEELTDALADLWDGMDEYDYDPVQVDAYLAELEKRESDLPEFDVERSLEAFHQQYADHFETPAQPVMVKPVRRRLRISLIAAVMAVTVMLCSMGTVQGFGFDLFGAIARWTAETFNFSSSEREGNQNAAQLSPSEDVFSRLRDTVSSYEIQERVVPNWLPDGFEFKEVIITPKRGMVGIWASYCLEERSVSITVRQYTLPQNMDGTAFEKDETSVTLYERGGVAHYIMTNKEKLTAKWVAGERLLCSISGDLSEEEMQQIIDSMHSRKEQENKNTALLS